MMVTVTTPEKPTTRRKPSIDPLHGKHRTSSVRSPQSEIPTIEIPGYLAPGRLLIGLQVDGNCMEPQICNGDVVVIDLLESNPINGDAVAVVGPKKRLIVKQYVRRGSVSVLVDARGREYPIGATRLLGVVVHVNKGATGGDSN